MAVEAHPKVINTKEDPAFKGNLSLLIHLHIVLRLT